MSCAIFTRATSALSPAWGGCRHVLTSPAGVQLGLTSCVCLPPHYHHPEEPPGLNSCCLSSVPSVKHARKTYINTQRSKHFHVPRSAVRAHVFPQACTLALEHVIHQFCSGPPPTFTLFFSPPQSHRVTRAGGDVTCTESASRSE